MEEREAHFYVEEFCMELNDVLHRDVYVGMCCPEMCCISRSAKILGHLKPIIFHLSQMEN